MPEIARIWNAEYVYRHAFPGITHTQYLDDTTPEERQWMTHIHVISERIRAENEERRAREITGGV